MDIHLFCEFCSHPRWKYTLFVWLLMNLLGSIRAQDPLRTPSSNSLTALKGKQVNPSLSRKKKVKTITAVADMNIFSKGCMHVHKKINKYMKMDGQPGQQQKTKSLIWPFGLELRVKTGGSEHQILKKCSRACPVDWSGLIFGIRS